MAPAFGNALTPLPLDDAPTSSIESGPEAAAAVSEGLESMAPTPLSDIQEPQQDPKQRSVEAQLADLRNEVAGLKAAIEAIAKNESLPAEVRIQAIQAALGASSAPAATAAAQTQNPPTASAQAAAPQGAAAAAAETKPAPETKAAEPASSPPTQANGAKPEPAADPLMAALDKGTIKDPSSPAKPTDLGAALEKVDVKPAVPKAAAPAADLGAALDKAQVVTPAKPVEVKSAPTLDLNAALEKVLPTGVILSNGDKSTAPEAAPKPTDGVKVAAPPAATTAETKSAPQPAKLETTLSPELIARAQAIGEKLAKDFAGASSQYGKLADNASREAVKIPMDAATRSQFNEALTRTFAARAIRNETAQYRLADHSPNSVGHELEHEMRYQVMARILGDGKSANGNDQAKQIIRDVAQERVNEILGERSTVENGAENVALARGLAKRFKVDIPTPAINAEKAEIRESALDEFKAVLGAAGVSVERKEELLRGVVRQANKGDTIISEQDLAPLFAERINADLEASRNQRIDQRRAELSSLTTLTEAFGVEEDPAVAASLKTMKLEIAAGLLDEGVTEKLNDPNLEWEKTAEALAELRDEAVEISGIKEDDANRPVVEKLKEYFGARKVQSLDHARELLDGVEEFDSELDLSDKDVDEIRAVIKAEVSGRLDELLAGSIEHIDEILLTDAEGESLNTKEKKARSYIHEVAEIGDDLGDETLTKAIKVKLGTHEVKTILEGDIKNVDSFEQRANEAEDSAWDLGIRDELSGVVVEIAKRRFGHTPQSIAEIEQLKDDLAELIEEWYLKPEQTKSSESEERKNATKELLAIGEKLEKDRAAIEAAAAERARAAAEAARAEALSNIAKVLEDNSVSTEQRMAAIRKITTEK